MSTEPDPAVLECRTPADLDPWAGVAVLALHSHTAEEPCDSSCSVYERTQGTGSKSGALSAQPATTREDPSTSIEDNRRAV